MVATEWEEQSMFGEPKAERRRVSLWKVAVGALFLTVGPCGDLQHPPRNTELFYGVAIARGAEPVAPEAMEAPAPDEAAERTFAEGD